MLTLTAASLTTASTIDAVGEISIAYAAQTAAGIPLDRSLTLSGVTHEVLNQFTATTTTPLDAVIDIDNGRQQFTGNTPLNDVLLITPASNAGLINGTLNAVYGGYTTTIAGNFSWMDTDTTPGVDGGELIAAFGVVVTGGDTAAATINAASDLITVTVTEGVVGGVAPGLIGDATMTFTNAGVGVNSAILPTSTYVVNTTLRYETFAVANAAPVAGAVLSTVALQTNVDAGEWTIEGVQGLFNYVAVGYAGLQNTLTLSNSGTRSAPVVLEAFDDAGNTYGPVTLADELAGTSNMKISGDDLITLLSVPSGTKLSVLAIVNAPTGTIDFSGFTQKVDTGRQLMNVVVR